MSERTSLFQFRPLVEFLVAWAIVAGIVGGFFGAFLWAVSK